MRNFATNGAAFSAVGVVIVAFRVGLVDWVGGRSVGDVDNVCCGGVGTAFGLRLSKLCKNFVDD